MKDYTVDKIRNVCLLGHGGAGKTSLAEAIMYNTGVLERLGKVSEGTSTLDFDPEEIRRKVSVSTALGPCEWKDCKINILDTPGYFDFVGEVRQGMKVADCALIVVSGKSGVSVGTEKGWEYANDCKIPRAFFINKMDEENADFDKTMSQLEDTFGKSAVAFTLPIIIDGKFRGIVDVLEEKAFTFEKDKFLEVPVPEGLKAGVTAQLDKIKELVAETDEVLMEKYFAGEEFSEEDIETGLRKSIMDGSLAAVYCGSSMLNQGVKYFMDAIIKFMPSPRDLPPVTVKKPDSEEEVKLKCDNSEPLSALVFKTIADPFVGRISIIKVCSGMLRSNSAVYNSVQDKQERIAQIFLLRGKKQIPVDKLNAGDIGAVAKLLYTGTNDTLCEASRPFIIEGIEFPEPVVSMAVEPKAKGDEEKISAGLHKLLDEDPTFKIITNNETHQTLISGMGEQHLDVIVSKLKNKFNVAVNLTDPRIPYREAIRKKVKVEGKHKKQSGGHGQYGHVWIEFEPCDAERLLFEEKIFGGSVPKQYYPAVEKGLLECINKGVLAGYPVVNLKATLIDGSYHDVDSSEMAFKLAAHIAFKKGLEQASPVLLEPIDHIEVLVPESYMGDVIGDLNKRRGRILGMNPAEKNMQQVVAEVPEGELFKYATDLRSMTQGRGNFKQSFERYEDAPPMVSAKIIEEARKHMQEEEEGA